MQTPTRVHSLTSFRLINVVKNSWPGSVHEWATVQWKITIHGKPSAAKIQNRSTDDFTHGCTLVPDQTQNDAQPFTPQISQHMHNMLPVVLVCIASLPCVVKSQV